MTRRHRTLKRRTNRRRVPMENNEVPDPALYDPYAVEEPAEPNPVLLLGSLLYTLQMTTMGDSAQYTQISRILGSNIYSLATEGEGLYQSMADVPNADKTHIHQESIHSLNEILVKMNALEGYDVYDISDILDACFPDPDASENEYPNSYGGKRSRRRRRGKN